MHTLKVLIARWKDDIAALPLWLYVIYVLAILAAIVIRWSDLGHPGFYYDTVVTQYDWARTAGEQGAWNMWRSYAGFLDYLPGSVVLIGVLHNLSQAFAPGTESFIFVLKLFNALGDFFLMLLLYFLSIKFVPKVNNRIWIQIIALVSPALWTVSTLWGQFDIWSINLSLLCWLLLAFGTQKKHWIWSGILLVLAMSFKMQFILMLPLILFTLWQKTETTSLKLLGWIVGIIALCVILILSGYMVVSPVWLIPLPVLASGLIAYLIWRKSPRSAIVARTFGMSFWIAVATYFLFFLSANLERFFTSYGTFFIRGEALTSSAANIWNILGITGSVSQHLLEYPTVTARLFSISALLFVGIVVIARLVSLKNITRSLRTLSIPAQIWGVTLVTIAYYFFSANMHERYLHTGIAMSLVLLSVSSFKFWQTAIQVIILHLAYTLNIISVYYYFSARSLGGGHNVAPQWIITFFSNLTVDLTIAGATCIVLAWYGLYWLAPKTKL